MLFLMIFIFGLIFGSFINVLIFRLPLGLTLMGRSMCPKCKEKISWYDNIPLLSFLLLGGKCRHCKEKISVRYPIIEFITALGFIGLYLYIINLGFPGIGLYVYLLFIFILILPIFVIDILHQIVPDELVYAGIILNLGFLLITDGQMIYASLLAGFVAASFLLLIHLITKGKGMGLGDVKLAIFLGMFLGLTKIIPWLYLSFLTGAIVGIILILGKKARFGKPIAFGPFLILGAIGAYFWGEKLVGVFIK
jgi:prepilin signal peptidase PulO-like enzyme (type II secretory pathway)